MGIISKLFGSPSIEKMIAKRDVNGLLNALGHKEKFPGTPEWKWHDVIDTLGNIGDPRAFMPIITIFKEGDHGDRVTAVDALGKLGDARAVDPLIAALNDENPNIRDHAAQALGVLRDPRAVNPLIALLKDENELVRGPAEEALTKIGDVAIDPLMEFLKRENDKEVYWRAIQAIALMHSPRAVEALLTAISDKRRDVRSYAVDYLARSSSLQAILKQIVANDPSKLEPLTAALNEFRNRIEKVLEAIGSPKAK
jgi:HEAT repeat protein